MIFEQKTELINLISEKAKYSFLPTGDVFEFTVDRFMVNQFQGNTIDGALSNIYLRVYQNDKIKEVYPLLGSKSNSKLYVEDNKLLLYKGEAAGIQYRVSFAPSSYNTWFWKIDLYGEGEDIDIIYSQDIGVGEKGGIITNELYLSQYLDHKVLESDLGYVVCSRQNQSQGGFFPYLQQGSLSHKLIGFSTDGMQFFGKSYKDTNIPENLYKDLPNVNYQYELSFTALQSEKLHLSGAEEIIFYGIFKENHADRVEKIDFKDEVEEAFKSIEWKMEDELRLLPNVARSCSFGKPLSSDAFTEDEINEYFPEQKLKEIVNGKLLSFFTKDHKHVVLKEKELLVERPHGNIITTLVNPKEFKNELITSTNYMYGFFNGQITIGNTSMNKLLSVHRGLLNILKNTGQRIYIKTDSKYRILTLPAAYELGINYSKWYYKIEDDILMVTSWAAADTTDIFLAVSSSLSREYEFIITNQLVMGSTEFLDPVNVEEIHNELVIKPSKDSDLNRYYPELSYRIKIDQSFTYSDDRIFYEDEKPRNGTLLTLQLKASDFSMRIHGDLERELPVYEENFDFDAESKKYVDYYKEFMLGFHLEGAEASDEIDKLNEIIWWYTHNALVHFAVPHGLEQSGGAAWGTRDICQGPMEYFLATGHIELARNVLLKIFSYQSIKTGEWPQWFMFDRYPYMAGDCHGDVVFWPLKCISDYLRISNDIDILNETVSYTDSTKAENLYEHIKRAIDNVKERFLYDTALISYAGGDWDDTLQPASQELKEKLVSSWTEALAYQTILGLSRELVSVNEEYGNALKQMAEDIKDSFRRYLINEDVIAGFAYLEGKDNIGYMLHPKDNQTGIHYRLLPMTRSIISELVDKDQAEKNIRLIKEHLTFPDGIRLMDHPARYEGGISKFFQRAEQASNVGREISLQYVHAHIRYIEAMAKYGNSEDAWNGLFVINPINIRDIVTNASLRQSNAYFSSSEGAYLTRYDYQENFDLLRRGEIDVKGGWRIYSSGPGIYLARVITDVLGIRISNDRLTIDPVLPLKLDGLKFTYHCFDKEFTFVYKISGSSVTNVTTGTKEIPFLRLNNPYRLGGVFITKEILDNLCGSKQEIIINLA